MKFTNTALKRFVERKSASYCSSSPETVCHSLEINSEHQLLWPIRDGGSHYSHPTIPFPSEPQDDAQRERGSGHPLAWVASDAACGPKPRRRYLREASLCKGVFTAARRAGSHCLGFGVERRDGDVNSLFFFFFFAEVPCSSDHHPNFFFSKSSYHMGDDECILPA